MRATTLIAVALATASGCSSNPSEQARACSSFEPSCTPTYEPTFDEIYARTLVPTCAISANCHASAGKQGRVTFVAPDQAYDALVARELVSPGDAACSTVSVRISSTDPFTRMPPGRALPAGEVCAIQQWIAHGAPR